MNILAVDDERPLLNQLENAIREAIPDCKLAGFTTSTGALEYAASTQVDIAFLDIKMPGMTGLELAKRLKDIYGQTNVIFVTGYSEYAKDAFDMHVSGYLIKPVEAGDIRRELEYLRHPVIHPSKGVRVQCFGSFAMFIDGQPLMFTHAKVKELLALLIHKQGASVNNAEIAAVLWEDRPYDSSLKSHTRTIISQLTKLLKSNGVNDILLKAWNSTAIDVKKFDCDYYDFLRGRTPLVNTYTGEYMHEYSWAEFTAARLDNLIR